jgi:site-specific recombinase XerD
MDRLFLTSFHPPRPLMKTVVKNPQFFADHLVSKRLSGASIQLYLTVFKIFCGWAGHEVRVSYRIPNREKKKNPRKQLNRWVDEQDIAKCLGYAFEYNTKEEALAYRIIVRLLCETGAQVREIATLRVENVEIEDRIVWLMDSKTELRPAFFSIHT